MVLERREVVQRQGQRLLKGLLVDLLFCLLTIRLVGRAASGSLEIRLSLFDHLLDHGFLDFHYRFIVLVPFIIRQQAQVLGLVRRDEGLLDADSARLLRELHVAGRGVEFRLLHAGPEACARGHLRVIQVAEFDLHLLLALVPIQHEQFSTLLRKESAVSAVQQILCRAAVRLIFFLISLLALQCLLRQFLDFVDILLLRRLVVHWADNGGSYANI